MKQWIVGLGLLLASSFGAEEVRVGFFPNITHAQALYGKATGEFQKQIGKPVKWTSFNAGPTAVESLFNGSLDMTFIGPGPTVNGFVKSRGESFVVIAGAASGGAGLVVRNDSEINSEKDFNGKKIATPQLGNTQDIAARVWLEEKKYKLKEKGGTVTVLPIANADQILLFQKKEIDGAWAVEPWLSRLELEAGGKLIVDEKSLWPEGRYVTTHLLVRRKFLQEHPDVVKKFLEAHVDITQTINRDKAAAAKVLNSQLTKETGKPLKDEVIAQAMQRVEFTWDPVKTSLLKGAESAHSIGFIKQKPELSRLYVLEPLNSVLKAKGQKAIE